MSLKQRYPAWIKAIVVPATITILGVFVMSIAPGQAHAAITSFINPTGNTPAWGTPNNETVIPTGSWLEFEYGFEGGPIPDVKDKDGYKPTKVGSWVNVDTLTQNIDSYHNSGSYDDITFTDTQGDDFYIAPGCYKTGDDPFAGQPCQEQGFSLNARSDDNSHTKRTYTIRIKLTPKMLPGSRLCLDAHIGRITANTLNDGSNDPYHGHWLDNTPTRCYKVGYSKASGTVKSTLNVPIVSGNATNVATGNDFKITDDCYLPGIQRWASSSTGYWESDKSHYALGAPMCFKTPPAVYQNNTYYDLKQYQFYPPGLGALYEYIGQVAGFNCGNDSTESKLAVACNHNLADYTAPNDPSYTVAANKAYDATSDDNFDFVYVPRSAAPTIAKSATPQPRAGDPAAPNLAPGEPMKFNINSTNDHDGYLKDYVLEDPIPQNIQPDAANLTLSASLAIHISKIAPGFPDLAAQPLACSTWDASYHAIPGYGVSVGGKVGSYDNDGRFIENGNQYQCYIRSDGGVPRIYLHFVVLPYRADLNVAWTGAVKSSAAEIGSYPYAYPNCGNNAGLVTSCLDYSATGLQGVTNQARAGFDLGGSGWTYSNATYNPIPGQINCVRKWGGPPMRTALGYGLIDDPGCPGAKTPAAGDKWVYNPTLDNYKQGVFHTQVDVNTNPAAGFTGPIFYDVIDQTGSAALDAAIDTPNTSSPSVPLNNPIKWTGVNSTTYPGGDFWFQSDFKDVPGRAFGTSLTNTSQVCYIEYWNPAKTQVCSNASMQVTLNNVKNPYLTTANGDVHAGGGIVQANGSCSTTLTSNNQASSKGSADYFVTASGAAGNLFNSAIGARAPTYGAICRPDVITSANTYHDRAAGAAPTFGNNFALPSAASQKATYDGRVADAPGGTVLHGGSVGARWTLHVKGDLYIDGDIDTIENNLAILNGSAEQQHSSFGVVVDGNLFIAPNVTKLNGFFFVKGTINTCSNADGSQTLGAPFTVAQCRNQLQIIGLAMASKFRLNRTYMGPAEADPAEYVTMNDRLYTATPPGFSDLSKSNATVYIGDTRPRY